MNIDPLFMTIGLAALAVAVYLKVGQIKRRRIMQRRIKQAIEQATVNRARAETRGKILAGEREWRAKCR